MKFGLHLVRKGWIASDQLVSALERQNALTVPIGQLAVEEGLLTIQDVFEILHRQADTPLVEFGQVAIELDMLSAGELAILVARQSELKPSLAEILVEQGVLSRLQAAERLREFRNEECVTRSPPRSCPLTERHDGSPSKHGGRESAQLTAGDPWSPQSPEPSTPPNPVAV